MKNQERRLMLHTYSPADRTEIKTLLMHDSWAAQSIKAAEELIETAKAYRLRLAERVREPETMQFHTRVTLLRVRNSWTKTVRFFLRTEKVFSDGTAQTPAETVYSGKERHAAVKEFRQIQKAFPLYEFVENIEKPKWER